jgi:hypothetical protein
MNTQPKGQAPTVRSRGQCKRATHRVGRERKRKRRKCGRVIDERRGAVAPARSSAKLPFARPSQRDVNTGPHTVADVVGIAGHRVHAQVLDWTGRRGRELPANLQNATLRRERSSPLASGTTMLLDLGGQACRPDACMREGCRCQLG